MTLHFWFSSFTKRMVAGRCRGNRSRFSQVRQTLEEGKASLEVLGEPELGKRGRGNREEEGCGLRRRRESRLALPGPG